MRAKDVQLLGKLKLTTVGIFVPWRNWQMLQIRDFLFREPTVKTFTSTPEHGKETFCFHEVAKLGGCEGSNFLCHVERAVGSSRQ